MHVLEEDKKSLSDQLEFPTRQGCIHLKKKKKKKEYDWIITWFLKLTRVSSSWYKLYYMAVFQILFAEKQWLAMHH